MGIYGKCETESQNPCSNSQLLREMDVVGELTIVLIRA